MTGLCRHMMLCQNESENIVIKGSCHCGSVDWQLEAEPITATSCNCTVCSRYGVLWAYGIEGQGIEVSDRTNIYIPGAHLGFHFCGNCACLAYWRTLNPGDDGQHRVAVNLRLAELKAVSTVPIRHFDGLESYKDLPSDGKCVADSWA